MIIRSTSSAATNWHESIYLRTTTSISNAVALLSYVSLLLRNTTFFEHLRNSENIFIHWPLNTLRKGPEQVTGTPLCMSFVYLEYFVSVWIEWFYFLQLVLIYQYSSYIIYIYIYISFASLQWSTVCNFYYWNQCFVTFVWYYTVSRWWRNSMVKKNSYNILTAFFQLSDVLNYSSMLFFLFLIKYIFIFMA